MMRMRTKSNGMPEIKGNSDISGGSEKKWELRPGGMLVQKRTDSDQNLPAPPVFRVRVKYGSIYHEVYINSEASFGELKKMLSGPTGLHHQDQKLFYKGKERDSNAFLDRCGVKDKSKLVLVEDAISQEKRYLEMRKTAKMEKAAKSISKISLEVDSLGAKVSALESISSKGGKVAEKDVTELIELLMNQLLQLDGIVADGDVKLQRKMQVKRVQKYVEILDMLKIKSSTPTSKVNDTPTTPPTPTQTHPKPMYSNGSNSSLTQQQQARHSFTHSLIDSPKQEQHEPSRHSTSGSTSVVITTQWETFDSTPARVPSTTTTQPTKPSFTWDLL